MYMMPENHEMGAENNPEKKTYIEITGLLNFHWPLRSTYYVLDILQRPYLLFYWILLIVLWGYQHSLDFAKAEETFGLAHISIIILDIMGWVLSDRLMLISHTLFCSVMDGGINLKNWETIQYGKDIWKIWTSWYESIEKNLQTLQPERTLGL